jgi:hypothetical protein
MVITLYVIVGSLDFEVTEKFNGCQVGLARPVSATLGHL